MSRKKLSRTTAVVAGELFAALAGAQEAPKAISDALKRADDAVAKIIALQPNQRNFDNTVGALDAISVRLDNDTSIFIFMQNVSPDPKLRPESRAADELVTNWASDLGKREDLFKAIKAYADTKPKLEGEQKRLLEFTMRDYRLSGMDLPEDKRNQLKEIEKEINKLSIDFQTNIADDETVIPLSMKDLEGVPEDTINRQTQSNGIVIVRVDGPTYISVMEHALNSEPRHKVWLAYRRRAGLKNKAVLEEIVKLRDQAAHLLGYENSVDMVLATRMAKDSKTVAKFYNELTPVVMKKALMDRAEFDKAKQDFTKDSKAILDPWDYAFYSELVKKQKYAVDTDKVAEYFPVEKVFQGFFDITSKLYSITYKDITADAKSLGGDVLV